MNAQLSTRQLAFLKSIAAFMIFLTFTSNSEVRFHAMELYLNRVIEVVDVQNISFIGFNNTVLVCSNNTHDQGLFFKGVENLMIKKLILK